MMLFQLFLVVLGSYLSAYVAYQMLLLAANTFVVDPPEFEPVRRRRFNIIIPAHNEELYLPRLLHSLQAQAYPADRYRVTVVADNCEDGTTKVCEPFDADVLIRTDAHRRGKGHTIQWALEQIVLDSYDAVLIIDGDSAASPELLKQLNLQIERGDRFIQCYNGVANPGQSWFTRLLNVSRTISNDILHPGKRKLGLSSHLMGNGMCFDVASLRSLGWQAFSVGEDWEYYAKLILMGGSVGYSRRAKVFHQESVNLKQASSQRLRWSSGRFDVLRRYGPRLVGQGVRTGNLKIVDAALPLAFPNPSLGINLTFVGAALAGVRWFLTREEGMLQWFAVLAAAQLLLFVVGILYTKDRLASAASLMLAPLFLIWKMGIDILSVFGIGLKEWKPTERRVS